MLLSALFIIKEVYVYSRAHFQAHIKDNILLNILCRHEVAMPLGRAWDRVHSERARSRVNGRSRAGVLVSFPNSKLPRVSIVKGIVNSGTYDKVTPVLNA